MARSPDSDSEPASDSMQPVRAIWLSAPQEPQEPQAEPPGDGEDSAPDDATVPPPADETP